MYETALVCQEHEATACTPMHLSIDITDARAAAHQQPCMIAEYHVQNSVSPMLFSSHQTMILPLDSEPHCQVVIVGALTPAPLTQAAYMSSAVHQLRCR